MDRTTTLIFGKDFGIGIDDHTCITLPTSEVSDDITYEGCGPFSRNKIFKKTHSDGWEISAKLEADYYVWIDEFTAIHPFHGKIHGILDDKITVSSLEAWEHFSKNHKLEEFDFWDI